MRHKSQLQIRWADLDAFKHVNNAAYLVYMQEARADFTWYSRKLKGERPILADMVVARAEVDFVEPSYEGGFDLDVAIWVSRIGNSSFDLSYELTSEKGLHSRGRTVQVAVSMETKRSRPLTQEERDFLSNYLEG